MDNKTMFIKLAQARSAGYAQGLINRGCPVQEAAVLTHAYAHPENGMLQKRAANVQKFVADVMTCVQALHTAR